MTANSPAGRRIAGPSSDQRGRTWTLTIKLTLSVARQAGSPLAGAGHLPGIGIAAAGALSHQGQFASPIARLQCPNRPAAGPVRAMGRNDSRDPPREDVMD
jgi:hypothetical protein